MSIHDITKARARSLRRAGRQTATQAEARADVAVPFKCGTCEGRGVVTVIEAGCYHAGQNCPCGTDDVECADCGGDGRVRCSECQEDPATEISARGVPLCRVCEEREEEAGCDDGSEPSDPSCDSESHRLMVEFYQERAR